MTLFLSVHYNYGIIELSFVAINAEGFGDIGVNTLRYLFWG